MAKSKQQLDDIRQKIPVRSGVLLRPLEAADAPAIIEALEADPSIRDRVTVAAQLKTEKDVQREAAASRHNPILVRYVIEEEGKVVGLITLWRDNDYFGPGHTPNPNAYGFGYFLHPAARGRGLATDSLSALMDTARDKFHVDSFIAFCEDNNSDSIAILRKLGLGPTPQTFDEPINGWRERMYEKKVTK